MNRLLRDLNHSRRPYRRTETLSPQDITSLRFIDPEFHHARYTGVFIRRVLKSPEEGGFFPSICAEYRTYFADPGNDRNLLVYAGFSPPKILDNALARQCLRVIDEILEERTAYYLDFMKRKIDEGIVVSFSTRTAQEEEDGGRFKQVYVLPGNRFTLFSITSSTLVLASFTSTYRTGRDTAPCTCVSG